MCTCSIYPPIIIIYCFSLPVILFQAAVSLQCFIFSPLYHLLCPIFLPSLHLKSSQFMQPKITTLPQRALQSVQHTTLSKQCLMTHTSILVYLQKIFWQLNNVNWLQMLFLGVQTKGKGRKIQKWKKKLWFRDIKLIYNTHLYVNVNVDLDQIPGRQNRYNMEHIISSKNAIHKTKGRGSEIQNVLNKHWEPLWLLPLVELLEFFIYSFSG